MNQFIHGCLVDLDGTLISGAKVLEHADWLLERLADHFILVSNNAEHSQLQLSEMLAGMGLVVPPTRILLAGVEAIRLAALQFPGASTLILGSPTLIEFAQTQGLNVTGNNNPDVVLVLRDRGFTYDKLARAAAAVSRGAKFVSACPDTSHPGADGEPVPETGALAAAVQSVAGKSPDMVVGKPHPALFERACHELNLAPAQVAMIGDNEETDGEGARRMGMTFFNIATPDFRAVFSLHFQSLAE